MAESYVTIAEADAYFSTRLGVDVWDSSSSNDKQKSLYEATRAIDRLAYIGVTTDYYNQHVFNMLPSGQTLQFPRNGDIIIPQGIKNACCECAIAFLDGVDTDAEIQNIGIISDTFASVKQVRQGSFIQPYTLAGIPSARAWMELIPFLADPREVRMVRVS